MPLMLMTKKVHFLSFGFSIFLLCGCCVFRCNVLTHKFDLSFRKKISCLSNFNFFPEFSWSFDQELEPYKWSTVFCLRSFKCKGSPYKIKLVHNLFLSSSYITYYFCFCYRLESWKWKDGHDWENEPTSSYKWIKALHSQKLHQHSWNFSFGVSFW